jgi:glutamine synthetase
MIRVPMYKPLKGQSTRIELRTVDAACNPYLAYAVTLAAGMKGIDQGLDLPREAEDDVWSLTDRERRSLGIEPLPKSLYEAIEIAEGSELLAETLGEHVFDFFLRNKRAEWDEYRGQVSAFERDRMLPVV